MTDKKTGSPKVARKGGILKSHSLRAWLRWKVYKTNLTTSLQPRLTAKIFIHLQVTSTWIRQHTPAGSLVKIESPRYLFFQDI